MDWSFFGANGNEMFFRWVHYFAGVVWIGMLYFFNFVQMDWFAQLMADDKLKSAQGIAVRTLLPRVLKWFRYGALFTFISGVALLGIKAKPIGFAYLGTSSWWIFIATGSVLGTIMFLNVWLIIWPNQKIVMASAEQVAAGGQALPEAAAAGAKARRASRHNTLFSLPMLLFMGAASHLPLNINPDYSGWTLTAVLGVIIGALELNAIFGNVKPIDNTMKVTHFGVLLAVVLYAVIEVIA